MCRTASRKAGACSSPWKSAYDVGRLGKPQCTLTHLEIRFRVDNAGIMVVISGD